MRRPYTFENDYWVFFGYGVNWEPGRCDRCYPRLYSTYAPPPEAINCWKDAISSRRGCVNFDEIIGPWTEWYDLERDYPNGRSIDGV